MTPETQYRADYEWTKTERPDHQWQMQIRLDTPNLLAMKKSDHQSIAETLQQNEEAIRRRIFEDVAEKLIPQVIKDSGGQRSAKGNKPEHTTSDIQYRNAIAWEIKNGALHARNDIQLLLQTSSDKAINAQSALDHAKGHVAAVITDSLVHNLKKSFLGVEKSSVKSQYRFNGNRLAHYEFAEKLS